MMAMYNRQHVDSLYLMIQEEGGTISEEEIKQLFTRFYRVKNEATSQVGGSGLGLYLTKFFKI